MTYTPPKFSAKVVDLKTMEYVKTVLCYHLQSHNIKATERVSRTCADGDEYDAMMQRHFWHTTYYCRMSCDQCGWDFSFAQTDPSSSDWVWAHLAISFMRQIPADCDEAKNLRVIKDVLES